MNLSDLRDAALAAALALTACPFNVTTAQTDDRWTAPPLVVTAGRNAQPQDRVPASITVLTREDIALSAAPDLLELLRLEAGIDIARAGGPGAQTSVFLRGSNSNHVLVLIDGVRVAASGTGAFAWELLDPALIERIEIVRGPRAARWGSDAIGGVIQIFTRRGHGAAVALRAGSDQDLHASAGLGSEALGVQLAARRVAGDSAQNPNGFAYDPDKDGFRNVGAAAGGTARIAGGELDWHGRIADGRNEFDQGESEFTNASLRVEFRRALGELEWQIGAGLLDDRLETESAFGTSLAKTRRWQAEMLLQRRRGEQPGWLIGVDAWREDGESRDQWDQRRDNVALFAGIEGGFGRLDYELALRADDDDNFGVEPSGNLGLNWRLSPAFRAYAGVGRAFRAPSFSQLYSPGFGGLFAGNPDLEPERAWSSELGLEWSPGPAQQLSLNLFRTRIEDLIDFSGPDFGAINIARAAIDGLELTHRYAHRGWHSRLNLTWQDAEDRDTGADLLRRPDFKGNWVLERRFGQRLRLAGELVHVGQRSDVGGVSLDDYTLINLRVRWQLSDAQRLELRVENLANREVEPLFGFNGPDRRIQLGWVWHIAD
ncbi:MAG: TonB-dependent vitamin B12 receptor [Wenzhouxiangellaceae bacterium]